MFTSGLHLSFVVLKFLTIFPQFPTKKLMVISYLSLGFCQCDLVFFSLG